MIKCDKITILFLLNLAFKSLEENVRLKKENEMLKDNLKALQLIEEFNL